MKNRLIIVVGVLLAISILVNCYLAFFLCADKEPDFHGSYQTEMNVGEGGIYLLNLDTKEMRFSINFTGINGNEDYTIDGEILRIDGRNAIVATEAGNKIVVSIDKKNEKLTYYDSEKDLLLYFEKKSTALANMS